MVHFEDTYVGALTDRVEQHLTVKLTFEGQEIESERLGGTSTGIIDPFSMRVRDEKIRGNLDGVAIEEPVNLAQSGTANAQKQALKSSFLNVDWDVEFALKSTGFGFLEDLTSLPIERMTLVPNGCVHIQGSLDDDTLVGCRGADHINGGAGDDHLRGDGGDDVLKGQAGDDLLYGGNGEDTLRGGGGDDHHLGAAGNDFLYGGAGKGYLFGGDGDDIVDPGVGNDIVSTGGIHAHAGDTIIFRDKYDSNAVDISPAKYEKLDLSAVTGIEDFADLKAKHMWSYGFANSGANVPDLLGELPFGDTRGTLIDDLSGTQIWLGFVAPNALDESNFIF